MKQGKQQNRFNQANGCNHDEQHDKIRKKKTKLLFPESEFPRAVTGERGGDEKDEIECEMYGKKEHKSDEYPRKAVDGKEDCDTSPAGIGTIDEERRWENKSRRVDSGKQKKREKQSVSRRMFQKDNEYASARKTNSVQKALAGVQMIIVDARRADESDPENEAKYENDGKHDRRLSVRERASEAVAERKESHTLIYEIPSDVIYCFSSIFSIPIP